MLPYRLASQRIFTALKSMTPEEIADLQTRCEFNRSNPQWKRLGKTLISAKRVAKPA